MKLIGTIITVVVIWIYYKMCLRSIKIHYWREKQRLEYIEYLEKKYGNKGDKDD